MFLLQLYPFSPTAHIDNEEMNEDWFGIYFPFFWSRQLDVDEKLCFFSSHRKGNIYMLGFYSLGEIFLSKCHVLFMHKHAILRKRFFLWFFYFVLFMMKCYVLTIYIKIFLNLHENCIHFSQRIFPLSSHNGL